MLKRVGDYYDNGRVSRLLNAHVCTPWHGHQRGDQELDDDGVYAFEYSAHAHCARSSSRTHATVVRTVKASATIQRIPLGQMVCIVQARCAQAEEEEGEERLVWRN